MKAANTLVIARQDRSDPDIADLVLLYHSVQASVERSCLRFAANVFV
jgi:hypothetical protein